MSQIPYVIESTSTPTAWLQENKKLLESLLMDVGAVLLRQTGDPKHIDPPKIVEIVCEKGIEYIYRSTPRTDLGNGLYTATEYPAGLSIPFHNENAFQREWPLTLLFICIEPALRGLGLTPIADCRKVTLEIDSAIKDRFQKKHVMYTRNYTSKVDLPWETVFQAATKAEVELFCLRNDIDYHWMPNGNLQTKQTCQAISVNPRTRESLWFNQAHLFHPASLDQATKSALEEMFPEKNFPRNASYGDGTTIEDSIIQEINHCYLSNSQSFQWQEGDVLVLDNMRVAHARTPFRGSRRVLAAMGHAYHPDYKAPVTTPRLKIRL